MKRILFLGAVMGLAACDQGRPSQDAPSSVTAPATATDDKASGSPPLPEAPPPPIASDRTPSIDSVPQRLTQQPKLLLDGHQREKPRQATVYTPPAGSPERVELMNALRAQTRAALGGDVVFVVSELRSNGQWSFGRMEPQWPNGRAISPSQTPLLRQNPDQIFDGLRTEAIWRKTGNRWQVYAHQIGSTDVWWLEHCGLVPANVMRGC